jgi:hypothetical protein
MMSTLSNLRLEASAYLLNNVFIIFSEVKLLLKNSRSV